MKKAELSGQGLTAYCKCNRKNFQKVCEKKSEASEVVCVYTLLGVTTSRTHSSALGLIVYGTTTYLGVTNSRYGGTRNLDIAVWAMSSIQPYSV